MEAVKNINSDQKIMNVLKTELKETKEQKLYRLRNELIQAAKEYAEPLKLTNIIVSGDLLKDEMKFGFLRY